MGRAYGEGFCAFVGDGQLDEAAFAVGDDHAEVDVRRVRRDVEQKHRDDAVGDIKRKVNVRANLLLRRVGVAGDEA